MLCSKRLRFEKVLKIKEKYWKLKPSLVCMGCAGLDHNQFGKYGNKLE